jgi:EYS protein
VVGYSSFLTYPTPPDVGLYMEAKLHFTTGVTNQVALLMFLGQSGTHRGGSDYLAVSFIKGYVLLTWDLGAGPRRIFTPRPVDERIVVHSVHIGRRGRRSWLKVDHFPNITGLAPGNLADLNVNGEFFIGGHETYNFTRLPHDLPVHTGFTGCIFDLVVKGGSGEPVVPQPRRGRNVQQCHQRVCDSEPCQGGYCLDYGASFSCQCTDGRSGPSCSPEYSVCSGAAHLCQEGSTCLATPAGAAGGYSCLCPLGRGGRHCQENVQVSDAKFTGVHSYMAVELHTSVRFNTHLMLQMKPESGDGLLLHLAQRGGRGDFLSLLLVNGSLFFTYSLGSGDSVTTIRAPGVALGEWQAVAAGRYGNQGYLQLGDQFLKGRSAEGLLTLDIAPTIFLGGLPDMAAISEAALEGPASRYRGCLRNLAINEASYPLGMGEGRRGVGVEDCDGTVCGGEVCGHQGECVLEPASQAGFLCQCKDRYAGPQCQVDARLCPS